MRGSASSSAAESRRGRPTTFAQRVLSAVRRIPHGRVATYGDIAALAGSPRAARAVGSVLRECRDPFTPCHRVVGAGGALGGFGRHPEVKRARLAAEGLVVSLTRIKSFPDVRWNAHRARATRAARPPV